MAVYQPTVHFTHTTGTLAPRSSFTHLEYNDMAHNTSRLNSGLKVCRVQKFLFSKKKLLLVPILHVRLTGWSGTEKFGLLQNALLNVSRVF
jgi:hypothetical protein